MGRVISNLISLLYIILGCGFVVWAAHGEERETVLIHQWYRGMYCTAKCDAKTEHCKVIRSSCKRRVKINHD